MMNLFFFKAKAYKLRIVLLFLDLLQSRFYSLLKIFFLFSL